MVAFFIGWDEQILSIFYGKVNLAITSSLNKKYQSWLDLKNIKMISWRLRRNCLFARF